MSLHQKLRRERGKKRFYELHHKAKTKLGLEQYKQDSSLIKVSQIPQKPTH